MSLFTLAELEAAAAFVHRTVSPTPQYSWPLLNLRIGTDVWVKHENHTPTGAFKVRGGLVYMDGLKRSGRPVSGVISATRGNHGQSIALAATKAGFRSVIYVPHGNSIEKNAAMRAWGAELVEHGTDFDSAKAEAARVAKAQGLHFVPSFHRDLVLGVATYALELFRGAPKLDRVYVPIGLGSGICGVIAVRDLLGLETEIIGVVSTNAPAYALSLAAGQVVETNQARTFADGVAVRQPDPAAFAMIAKGVARIIQVSDDTIAAAIRAYYEDTHNLAEGAGAAPLAGLMQDMSQGMSQGVSQGVSQGMSQGMSQGVSQGGNGAAGKRVAVVLCGGNIDTALFRRILSGETPEV